MAIDPFGLAGLLLTGCFCLLALAVVWRALVLYCRGRARALRQAACSEPADDPPVPVPTFHATAVDLENPDGSKAVALAFAGAAAASRREK